VKAKPQMLYAVEPDSRWPSPPCAQPVEGRASERDWKPPSYSTVSPYLVVAGAQKVIDFAKAVFGATELRRYDMPDGSIMHAEIRIDDTVIMVGDGGPEFPSFSSLLHIYVEDVDRVYERALKAGATPVEAPRARDGDPDKRGSVKDPCGNTWAIATQLPGKP